MYKRNPSKAILSSSIAVIHLHWAVCVSLHLRPISKWWNPSGDELGVLENINAKVQQRSTGGGKHNTEYQEPPQLSQKLVMPGWKEIIYLALWWKSWWCWRNKLTSTNIDTRTVYQRVQDIFMPQPYIGINLICLFLLTIWKKTVMYWQLFSVNPVFSWLDSFVAWGLNVDLSWSHQMGRWLQLWGIMWEFSVWLVWFILHGVLSGHISPTWNV